MPELDLSGKDDESVIGAAAAGTAKFPGPRGCSPRFLALSDLEYCIEADEIYRPALCVVIQAVPGSST